MDYQAFIRSPNALSLLCLMLYETGEGKHPFAMSQAQMAKALGLTRQQIREAIKKLLDFGLIQPTQQPSCNQANNQVVAYLTCCKITNCLISQTKQQPTQQPSCNQANNQVYSSHKEGVEKLNTLLIKPNGVVQLTDIQIKFNKWTEWMLQKHPYLFNKMQQLNFSNFEALLDNYGLQAMVNIVDTIDNDEKYRKKYRVLSVTMSNWLKRRKLNASE